MESASKKEELVNKCIKCGQKADKICLQCKAVHYCSNECQKSHWKTHRKKCKKKTETLTNVVDMDFGGTKEESYIQQMLMMAGFDELMKSLDP